MKTTSCTVEKIYAFSKAPRCGAKSKRNNKPCKNPAVKDKKRCRLHGGAAGSGARHGNINALKHGESTAEAKAFKQEIRQTIKQSKGLIKEFDWCK